VATIVPQFAAGAIEHCRQANAALQDIMLEAIIPGTHVTVASSDPDQWLHTISEKKMVGTDCS